MTPTKAKLLAFLHAEHAAGRGFPKSEQIAVVMGWKTHKGCLTDAMMRLCITGHVRLVRRKPAKRGWHYQWALSDGGEHVGLLGRADRDGNENVD